MLQQHWNSEQSLNPYRGCPLSPQSYPSIPQFYFNPALVLSLRDVT
jgi:hypothetical protein